MPNPFALRTAEQDGVCVISLEGFLDAHTAPQFEQMVQTEVQNGQYRLLVDCASFTYISSAGLGVFMSFVEEIRDRNGDIKICGLVPKVRHTFEILGFQDIFDLLDDVPAGLKRFASPEAAEGAK